MGRKPERTCIGCRRVYSKDEVVRIVAGPAGPLIDYREKLPGRAAYVCPRQDCIGRAFSREQLGRALRAKVAAPQPEAFLRELLSAIRQRTVSLLAIAEKAGKAAVGFSAVDDALRKERVRLLLYAADIAAGTKEKVLASGGGSVRSRIMDLTTAELGPIIGRELVGVVGILDQGFADALWRELERLKVLINTHA
jgi:predicted RNA-binding protein YlxR (DUF448 family)/ribosomal protein L30E